MDRFLIRDVTTSLDCAKVTRPSFSRAEIEGCGLRDYIRGTEPEEVGQA